MGENDYSFIYSANCVQEYCTFIPNHYMNLMKRVSVAYTTMTVYGKQGFATSSLLFTLCMIMYLYA